MSDESNTEPLLTFHEVRMFESRIQELIQDRVFLREQLANQQALNQNLILLMGQANQTIQNLTSSISSLTQKPTLLTEQPDWSAHTSYDEPEPEEADYEEIVKFMGIDLDETDPVGLDAEDLELLGIELPQ
jgi:hypothetical protein